MNENMLVDHYVWFLHSFASIQNMFMNKRSQTDITKVTHLFDKLWKSQYIEYKKWVRIVPVHVAYLNLSIKETPLNSVFIWNSLHTRMNTNLKKQKQKYCTPIFQMKHLL